MPGSPCRRRVLSVRWICGLTVSLIYELAALELFRWSDRTELMNAPCAVLLLASTQRHDKDKELRHLTTKIRRQLGHKSWKRQRRHFCVPLSLVCWDVAAAKAVDEAVPAVSYRTPAGVAVDRQTKNIFYSEAINRTSFAKFGS